jgi:putative membrane protein
VVIVMLAVFKNSLPKDLTVWLIFGLIILMAVTIQLYARKRRLDKEKQLAQPRQVPQQQA